MPAVLFPGNVNGAPPFLAQSEMLARISSLDWNATPLGSLATWTGTLTSATRMILTSPVPMAILAGRSGVMIYNDAYIGLAGKRHPEALGSSVFDSWPEVADFNHQVIHRVLAGEPVSFSDREFTFYRNNEAEQVFLDLDYSPLVDESGEVVAVLALVVDKTEAVHAKHDLARSQEQLSMALRTSDIVGIWDWDVVHDRIFADESFAQLYSVKVEDASKGAPFAAYLAAIHAEDLSTVADAIRHAIKTGEDFSQEFRLVQRNGGIHWVLAQGKPIFDDSGVCVRFPGVVVDITEHKSSAEALARSEAALRTLANAMPQIVWSSRPDGETDYYNARWHEFTGTNDASWPDLLHDEDKAAARENWLACLRTGEPFQREVRLLDAGGHYRWMLARALPDRNAAGRIERWYGSFTDIHDTRLIAAEREIVANELSHRIKNIFAVLSGIIGLSVRSAPEAQAFAEQLRRRIEAMGRAHDLVRPRSADLASGSRTSLFGLIGRLMEPFVDNPENPASRLLVTGEDVTAGDAAATPLALLVHELATNAAKYGALSQASGQIRVTGARQGDSYLLVWEETGGPPVRTEPPEEGFGTRLVRISVEGQLSGKLTRQWIETGLRVEILVPVTALGAGDKP